MENASKALIMAASVLIAMVIIGALLLMFNSLTSYQSTDTQTTREAQIVEFNNQYETYNRKDVRGSDLYSLLNKVVDYNRRKSTEGTGTNDEGQYIAYEPMTIIVDLVDESEFKIAETNKLITKSKYEQSSKSNDFENGIHKTVKKLETTYGQESLTNLVTGVTKIFINSSNPSEAEKKKAIYEFNKASKKITISDWNSIDPNSQIRNDVYTYYEYIQFKRARFECITKEDEMYSKKTGRIIKMEFKFTSKFN